MDLQNNAFHLDLSVMAKDGIVACPAGVIGFEKSQQGSEDIDVGSCAVLAVPDLQVLLRVHDFSMGTSPLPSFIHPLISASMNSIEMSLNTDPVVFSIVDSCPDGLLLAHSFTPTKQQLSVSGICSF